VYARSGGSFFDCFTFTLSYNTALSRSSFCSSASTSFCRRLSAQARDVCTPKSFIAVPARHTRSSFHRINPPLSPNYFAPHTQLCDSLLSTTSTNFLYLISWPSSKMFSPRDSKSTEREPSSPSPPLQTATPPPAEQGEYTRRPLVGFGARLADARNLRPDEAPTAPAPRTTATASIDDSGPSLLWPTPSPFATGMALKPVPKYGGVPGSYVSPYDGGGKTPGDQHLPASSTTVEEFEAKYGTDARRRATGATTASEDAGSEGIVHSDRTVTPTQPGRTISFGLMPPVAINDKGKGPAGPQNEKKVASAVPEGVSTPHCIWPYS
jgi:hypothetical protein